MQSAADEKATTSCHCLSFDFHQCDMNEAERVHGSGGDQVVVTWFNRRNIERSQSARQDTDRKNY